MDRIVTLCAACAELYKDGYKVTKIVGRTTTAKAPTCQHCSKRGHFSQYLISKKK